jgi:thioesterase domain-containing protein/aryl carrier-like protein
MVSHGSIVNYTQALCTQLDAQPGWQYATVSTLAADLGNTAIFCALASGGCLHVLPYELLTDGDAFAGYLAAHPIDVLKIVPSHLAALLAGRQQAALLPRRWLVLGGEVLPARLLQQVRQSGARCQILNHYGPTEATIGALVNPLAGAGAQPGQEQHAIALGLPIANMACCILNSSQQMLPQGVVGELYLSGVGLSQGYLNQPELTQQRFLPHPWQPGERLYKTGDLAYLNEEGLVVYAGRTDQQVKVRGYRIELEEIEAALRTHEHVREAVVIAREDGAGEKRLVAYIVGRQPGKPGSEDIKRYIRATLPEYMVPVTIVLLHELPLTRNGKVDRQRLLSLHKTTQDKLVIAEEQSQKTLYVEPRDKLEVQLQHIWEELLDVQPLSVTDNFFQLGGHSILAVRMIARIQKEVGQNVAMGTLFQYPTISELAVIIRKNDYSEIDSTLVPLQPQGSKPPFFCIHPSGGTVFRYANLARYIGNDQPFYGLQSPDLDGQGQSFSVLKDLADHYIALVKLVQPEGPYLLGGWSWGGVVAFEMAQQLRSQGEEIALLVAVDSVAPVHNFRPHEPVAPLDASDTALAQEMIKHLGLAVPDDDFASSPAEEQFQYALEHAKTLNTIPVDVNLEQLRRFARMLKTNAYAVGTYLPEMYPGDLSLLRASEEVKTVGPTEDPDDEAIVTEQRLRCGWNRLVQGEIDLYMIPGMHANLMSEPTVRSVAEVLKKCIDQALAKVPVSER